jgi:hypothetical protein
MTENDTPWQEKILTPRAMVPSVPLRPAPEDVSGWIYKKAGGHSTSEVPTPGLGGWSGGGAFHCGGTQLLHDDYPSVAAGSLRNHFGS